MRAKDDARIVLCRVCNRQLCDYPCNKIHLMSEIIAEAQLEAVEKYRGFVIEQGNKITIAITTGNGRVQSKSEQYLTELRKAAGKGE